MNCIVHLHWTVKIDNPSYIQKLTATLRCLLISVEFDSNSKLRLKTPLLSVCSVGILFILFFLQSAQVKSFRNHR